MVSSSSSLSSSHRVCSFLSVSLHSLSVFSIPLLCDGRARDENLRVPAFCRGLRLRGEVSKAQLIQSRRGLVSPFLSNEVLRAKGNPVARTLFPPLFSSRSNESEPFPPFRIDRQLLPLSFLFDAILRCLHAEPHCLPGEREPDESRRIASRCRRPSSLIGRSHRRRRRCLSFFFFARRR